MMRRAWIAAVLAAASAVSAAPTEMITPPAGWHRDAEQASALAQRLAEAKLGTAAAEAYVAERPGVALFASRRTVDKPSDAGAIARTLLDDLRASARRAALSGAPAEETAWHEGFDAASQAVTAELAWQDTAGHLETTARAVIASDGARLVAVTGECVASDGADRAARAACL
ncbi:MAG TPA: hypothetical protein VFP84_10285, partial [Kofleriaceae bacterium]|nr:hypothetical protein [Kofleriaceae bacterium]